MTPFKLSTWITYRHSYSYSFLFQSWIKWVKIMEALSSQPTPISFQYSQTCCHMWSINPLHPPPRLLYIKHLVQKPQFLRQPAKQIMLSRCSVLILTITSIWVLSDRMHLEKISYSVTDANKTSVLSITFKNYLSLVYRQWIMCMEWEHVEGVWTF